MTTVTEKQETPATAEPKTTTKANVGARAAHVAPAKGKAGKRTTSRSVAPKGKTAARGPQKKTPSPPYNRFFKGKMYTLLAGECDGKLAFQLKGGKTFDSMTAAAKSVTGYKAISGPAFWEPKKADAK